MLKRKEKDKREPGVLHTCNAKKKKKKKKNPAMVVCACNHRTKEMEIARSLGLVMASLAY